jgi:hypothetical protein
MAKTPLLILIKKKSQYLKKSIIQKTGMGAKANIAVFGILSIEYIYKAPTPTLPQAIHPAGFVPLTIHP